MSGAVCIAQKPENRPIEYDKDAKIIFKPKAKPRLTKEVKTSGYCCVVLDINETGIPENIRVNYCTHQRLASHFAAKAKDLRFSPALVGNEPVYRRNKTLKPGYWRYKRKKLIAGPNGYLEPKYPDAEIPRRPKNEQAKRKWVKKYFYTEKTCFELVS